MFLPSLFELNPTYRWSPVFDLVEELDMFDQLVWRANKRTQEQQQSSLDSSLVQNEDGTYKLQVEVVNPRANKKMKLDWSLDKDLNPSWNGDKPALVQELCATKKELDKSEPAECKCNCHGSKH